MRYLTFKQLLDAAVSSEKLFEAEEMHYCSKDEALIFIYHDKVYIIPWSRTVLSLLENKGFIRGKFKRLPHINELIPEAKRFYWNSLVMESLKEEPA